MVSSKVKELMNYSYTETNEDGSFTLPYEEVISRQELFLDLYYNNLAKSELSFEDVEFIAKNFPKGEFGDIEQLLFDFVTESIHWPMISIYEEIEPSDSALALISDLITNECPYLITGKAPGKLDITVYNLRKNIYNISDNLSFHDITYLLAYLFKSMQPEEFRDEKVLSFSNKELAYLKDIIKNSIVSNKYDYKNFFYKDGLDVLEYLGLIKITPIVNNVNGLYFVVYETIEI